MRSSCGLVNISSGEETPQAYKDVDMVVKTVCAVGIARKVVRLRPLAAVKG